MTDEEFWDSTIEKLNDLVSVHGAFNDKKLAEKRDRELAKKQSDKVGDIFIDEVGFL